MSRSSNASGPSFVIEANEERAEYVTERLREFNRPNDSPLWKNPPQPAADLQIYAMDDAGMVVGGLMGRTNEIPEWLEVSIMWVAEARRKRGLGTQLMCMAEEEARQRGCRSARLTTGNFQAPGFYEKLGYRLYGTLEDCPRGETVYYFFKPLV